MFYSKISHVQSDESLIDISSRNRNQNRFDPSCFSSSKSKKTLSEIFHQTNLNEILGEIQNNLTPIVEQLREHFSTRKQRWNCMKTCAKYLCENLIDEKFDLIENDVEFARLCRILNRSFRSKRRDVAVQTIDELESDFHRLTIEPNETKQKRISLKIDDETRQKLSHRSASRAFRKLTSDLHRRNEELPFQSHLKRYHQHHH